MNLPRGQHDNPQKFDPLLYVLFSQVRFRMLRLAPLSTTAPVRPPPLTPLLWTSTFCSRCAGGVLSVRFCSVAGGLLLWSAGSGFSAH